MQFQQNGAPEGGIGAEAPAPGTDRREREDRQMAVHAAVRGTDHGNKKAQGRGEHLHAVHCHPVVVTRIQMIDALQRMKKYIVSTRMITDSNTLQ